MIGGVPARVVCIHEHLDHEGVQTGIVDLHGDQEVISFSFVPTASRGDWVLVHAGFAIEKLNPIEAVSTWEWMNAEQLGREVPDFGWAKHMATEAPQ